METLKVEKGFPMPESKKLRKYPLDVMEVGDSFFVPNGLQGHISPSANKLHPKRFTTRTVTEDGIRGIRVWRFV